MRRQIPFYLMSFIMTATHISGATDKSDTPPPPPPIELQSEAFKMLRDPFWPVGYKPASESEKIEQSKIAELKARIKWPSLPLKGVTHAGNKHYIAIIDGVGLVEAGDIVMIERDSLIYRWKIDSVTSAGVRSTRLDVTETVTP